MIKCYAKPTRIYYKYVYTPWTQPVFNSDTTWGILSCSNYAHTYYAWKALNGIFPNTSGNYPETWESNNTQTAWWRWRFETLLRIKAIRIYPRATSDGAPIGVDTTYKLYDYDQEELLGVQVLTADKYPTDYALFEFNEPKILRGIHIEKDSTSADTYGGIGELVLDADLVHTEVATQDDYDYYVDYKSYSACPQTQQDKLQKIPHIFYDNTHRLLANNYLEVPPGSNCLWISHPDVFPHTGLHVYGNWEFQLKICRTVGTESFFRIWHLGGHYRFVDWYEYDGSFRIATVHDPNRSWTDHHWTSDGIPFNKWVWIRLRKVGASWICSQSEDGVMFRDKVGFAHDVDWPYYAIQLMEGVKGIIDLNESHLKKWADDESSCEYWWPGTSERKVFGDTPYNELSEKYTQYSIVRSDNGN